MIHSLTVKIGAVIILVEILVLSLTGGFYINRFKMGRLSPIRPIAAERIETLLVGHDKDNSG